MYRVAALAHYGPCHAVPDEISALRKHTGKLAALHGARRGLPARGHRLGCVWTGGDRLRWLAGMLTNAIQQQEPGTGSYNFILSAQGRIQGDCYAYIREQDVLLETSSEQVAAAPDPA